MMSWYQSKIDVIRGSGSGGISSNDGGSGNGGIWGSGSSSGGMVVAGSVHVAVADAAIVI